MVSRNIAVNSKPDFYRRWVRGEFGNRLRSWDTVEAVEASGYTGTVGIRYKIPASPFMKYDVPLIDVESEIDRFVKLGADPGLFTLGEMAPDQHILFQGEIRQSTQHYDLHYSLAKKQMRPALKEDGRHANGITALTLMKHFCNPTSYDDIMELLEIYIDHVIEFSCYSICLGSVPHRNTLVWEIRNY